MRQTQKAEGIRTPTLKRLMVFLCIAISWSALIVAIPIFVIACFNATHLTHQIRPDERDHIEVVSRYARTFIDQHKRLPGYDEYRTWVAATDKQHGTRLYGRGYSLHTECAKEVGDFCVSFWTGDVMATYRSGQTERSEAAIDGRLLEVWLTGSAFFGLMALAFFFKWAARSRGSSQKME